MKKKLEDFVIFGSMGDIKNFHQRIFVAYVENGIENGTITRNLCTTISTCLHGKSVVANVI